VVSGLVIWNSLLYEACVCTGIIHAIILVGEGPRLYEQYNHNAYSARRNSVLSYVAL
jgi:hypothetical protein